ncbi:glutathione S-transferase family protein [Litoribacillus peritrichatus]|uniref:Glutathione S-transferase n=1 Tax=Litoribacillus peritrichatus TaxID=718191 RepID=A0ABP7NDB3_9GAMM
MITLYQFTISQFCEKARWAIDHKGLIYQTENLLPGTHRKTALKVSPSTQLPILRHGLQHIQGSGKIIDYLDEQYQTRLLTPEDPKQRQNALELEHRLDKDIGLHLRRFFYAHMLQDSRQLRRLITHYGPWYSNNFYRLMLPMIKRNLVKEMKLNALEAERSRLIINNMLQQLDKKLENREYLIGDTFTRVDLTAAALLSPICQPDNHPYHCEFLSLPKELADFQNKLRDRPFFHWVQGIYQKHRWEVKPSDRYNP